MTKKKKTMKQNMNCPQCGDPLFVNNDLKVRCLMCGWGGEGVDLRTPQEVKIAPIMNKSRRWKFGVVAVVVATVLILPSLIMIPINQVRANSAMEQARQQMDKRLYASAAKTLYLAPRTMVTANKKAEMRKLLTDNVRWGKDTKSVNGAKDSLLKNDPDTALAELDSLDSDFPLGDEVGDLVDIAQELDIEGDLALSDDMLDDVISLPDDPELEGLDDLNFDDLDIDVTSVEGEKKSTAQQQQPAANGGTTTPDPLPEDELEIPEIELTLDDEQELLNDPLVSGPLDPQDVPDSGSPSEKGKLKAFFYLINDKATDNLYTIDLNGEVQPGADKKSGTKGYKDQGKIGRLYNRPIKGYEKRIIPFYRYYSAKKTDHFYSTNPSFSSGNPKANYQRQLVAGYIGKWSERKNKCFAGKLPLYNIFNPSTDTNFYSTDKNQVTNMVNKGKYKNLRVVGCIWPN